MGAGAGVMGRTLGARGTGLATLAGMMRQEEPGVWTMETGKRTLQIDEVGGSSPFNMRLWLGGGSPRKNEDKGILYLSANLC